MPGQRTDSHEGRATLARPSSCLLAGLLTLAVPLLAAPVVRAEPPTTPVLTATDPQSPNVSVEPRVQGSSNGIITAGVPQLRAGAFTAASPDDEIAIYASEVCEGEPTAVGTAEELDNAGIQVTVAEEAGTVTHFSARQSNGEGTSECSNAIAYEYVTELPEEPEEPGDPPGSDPPPAPNPPPPVQNDPIDQAAPVAPTLRTVPGGWANNNRPIVTGRAPGAGTVKIYADSACQGPAVARGSAAQLAAGLRIQVADNVVVALSGVSVAGGKASSCSAPVYYIEDSLRPRVKFTFGPAFKTKRRKVVFRFKDARGDRRGTVFRCKLDRRKWRRCKSPLRLKRLKPRSHVLRIKAVDRAGNRQKKATKRRFQVIGRR